jgi:hypothetical protein
VPWLKDLLHVACDSLTGRSESRRIIQHPWSNCDLHFLSSYAPCPPFSSPLTVSCTNDFDGLNSTIFHHTGAFSLVVVGSSLELVGLYQAKRISASKRSLSKNKDRKTVSSIPRAVIIVRLLQQEQARTPFLQHRAGTRCARSETFMLYCCLLEG